MKKIVSAMLALAMTMSMTVMAQTQTTETIYDFQQVANTIPEDGAAGGSRTLFVTAAKEGNKNIVYAATQKALFVYNETEPDVPIQTVSALAGLLTAIRADENYVYAGYSNKFCVFPKNQDGTITVPTTSDGKADLAKIPNAGAQGIKGMYVGKDGNVFGHLPDGIRRYQITDGVPAMKETINKKGIRAMNILETVEGVYRIVFISQDETTGESIFNVVDLDTTDGNRTVIFSAVLDSLDWPAAPSKFRNIEFLSETKVVANYNHESLRETERTFVIDFADLDNPQVSMTAKDGLVRGFLQQMYPGEIINWNETTTVTDYNNGGQEITSAALTGGSAKDVDKIGSRAYVACDKKGFFIFDVSKKTITDTPYIDDRQVTLDIGEPVTGVIEGRILAAAAVKAGGRTILYGKLKDSNLLCAYDVTDPQNIALLNSVETGGADLAVAVKEGYVLYATSKKVEIRAIESDGRIGAAVLHTISHSNTIQKIMVMDDILFINTQISGTKNALKAYDISDMAQIKDLGTVENTPSRDFAVEKLSNLRYRIYMIKASTIQEVSTIGLQITDIKNGLNGMAVTPVFAEGIPAGDVWPGFGLYGADSSVPGYIAQSSTNNGSIAVVKSGTVRVSAGFAAGDNGTVDNIAKSASNDEYIIDVSNPAAPAVQAFTPLISSEYAATVERIDSTKAALIRQYGKIANFRDYTDPANAEQLATANISGDCAVVLDNMLYTMRDKIIETTRLYNESAPAEVISEITVTDSDGNVLTTELKADDIIASVTVNNTAAKAKEITLIMALFDKATNSLQHMQVVSDSVMGTKTITDTISKAKLPDEQVGSMYLKVMAWDDLNAMLPLQGAKTIG